MLRAVVAGEHHDGVLRQAFRFQGIKDGADGVVAIGDDGGIDLLLLIQMLPALHGLGRRDVRRVALMQPHVDEERLPFARLDERDGVRRRGVQIRQRPALAAIERGDGAVASELDEENLRRLVGTARVLSTVEGIARDMFIGQLDSQLHLLLKSYPSAEDVKESV